MTEYEANYASKPRLVPEKAPAKPSGAPAGSGNAPGGFDEANIVENLDMVDDPNDEGSPRRQLEEQAPVNGSASSGSLGSVVGNIANMMIANNTANNGTTVEYPPQSSFPIKNEL